MSVERRLVFVALLAASPLFVSARELPLLAAVPVEEEALHGCDIDKLESALRDGLRGARQFRLADDLDAPLTLEITNCTLYETRTKTATQTGGPVTLPTGHGVARGYEGETGIATQSARHARLEARVGGAGRFVQVNSRPKDAKLSDAVESVRKAIDDVLAARGEWLLGVSQP